MTYEDLLTAAEKLGLVIREKDLLAYDGRIKGRRVAIRKTIPTHKKKACVLAEELGHYFTSSGDILNDSVNSIKQEYRARLWAYNLQIGLSGLIAAHKAGCKNTYDTAEFLNVPEGFLEDCLKCYREKYGVSAECDEYIVLFDPCIDVLTRKEAMRLKNDW